MTFWLCYFSFLSRWSQFTTEFIATLRENVFSSHRIYAAAILAGTTPNVSLDLLTRSIFVYVHRDTQESTVKQV